MEKKINKLFMELWDAYANVNPETMDILNHFKERENKDIVNDHIALRTLKSDKIGINNVAKVFTDIGYERKDYYEFKEKKLDAYYYDHPSGKYPKVFISELKIEELSKFAQEEAKKIIDSVKTDNLTYSSTHWEKSYKTYQKLYEESEYLAWFYAYGFIPNHFTVSVGDLDTFKELSEVNDWLEKLGYTLNSSGGKIKGSKGVGLEQSSTMAHTQEVSFSDGYFWIPSCFYEFALRHNGYEGFVASSADKIFESTNNE